MKFGYVLLVKFDQVRFGWYVQATESAYFAGIISP